MKLTWKNNNNKSSKKRPVPTTSNLRNLPFDFDQQQNQDQTSPTTTITNTNTQLNEELASIDSSDSSNTKQLALSFQAQGDKLAEDGKYREALGKWEAALTLIPENAVLHEQKAQVLLEIGDSWNALKAATRAAELEPSWAEAAMRAMKVLADAVSDAWITLGRAQLNFGEPDSAIESFDKALAIKPDSEEAQDDRHTASHLIKRRKQLHSAGLSTSQNRYAVSDETKSS